MKPLSQNKRAAEFMKHFFGSPVKPKTVFYHAYRTNIMSCSPFAVFQQLYADPEFADYEHIWVYGTEKALENDTFARYATADRVRFVRAGSPAHIEALATSEYLFTNAALPNYWQKKQGQTLVNTWHGTPLKAIGMEARDFKASSIANAQRNFLMSDYLVMPNRFTFDELMRSYSLGYAFRGIALDMGAPRVDALFSEAGERVRGLLERKLGEPLDGRRVVLYAPTFRSEEGKSINTSEVMARYMAQLVELLPQEFVVFFKVHNTLGEFFSGDAIMSSRLIFDEFETNELLAATDVLVTDYSSIFFDFICTGRPVLFFDYDKESYISEHGMNLAMEELPGTECATVGEIVEYARAIARGEYENPNWEKSRLRFAYRDDGAASKRVVDAIFRGKLDDDGVIDCRIASVARPMRGVGPSCGDDDAETPAGSTAPIRGASAANAVGGVANAGASAANAGASAANAVASATSAVAGATSPIRGANATSTAAGVASAVAGAVSAVADTIANIDASATGEVAIPDANNATTSVDAAITSREAREEVLVTLADNPSLSDVLVLRRVLRAIDQDRQHVTVSAYGSPGVWRICRDIAPDATVLFSSVAFDKSWWQGPRDEVFYRAQFEKFFPGMHFDRYVSVKARPSFVDDVVCNALPRAHACWHVCWSTGMDAKSFKSSLERFDEATVYCESASDLPEGVTGANVRTVEEASIRHEDGHIMSVLVIASFDSLNYALAAFASEMSSRGHDVVIVTSKRSDSVNNRAFDEARLAYFPVSMADEAALGLVDVVMGSPVKPHAFDALYHGIARRGLLLFSMMSLFSCVTMRINPDFVFTLGESKADEFAKYNLRYNFVAIGSPQYDSLLALKKCRAAHDTAAAAPSTAARTAPAVAASSTATRTAPAGTSDASAQLATVPASITSTSTTVVDASAASVTIAGVQAADVTIAVDTNSTVSAIPIAATTATSTSALATAPANAPAARATTVPAKLIERVLVVEQGGYPYGEAGKRQLGSALIHIARENPQIVFDVKFRYLPGFDGEALHPVPDHLMEYLGDAPDNLRPILRPCSVEDVVADYDAMITLWSTAYLDALMLDMPLLLIDGLDSTDVFDVRLARVQEAYDHLQATGCVRRYDELGAGIAGQFRLVDPVYAAREVYRRDRPCADAMAKFVELAYETLVLPGLRIDADFRTTEDGYYRTFANLPLVDAASPAFRARRAYREALNERLQEFVYVNRCMGNVLDLSPMEHHYETRFSDADLQRIDGLVADLKSTLDREFLQIKTAFFESAEGRCQVREDRILQDFYFDWLYETKHFDAIENPGLSELLAPESREYNRALVRLAHRDLPGAFACVFNAFQIAGRNKTNQLLKFKRKGESLRPFKAGGRKALFYAALFARRDADLIDLICTDVEKNLIVSLVKARALNRSNRPGECVRFCDLVHLRYSNAQRPGAGPAEVAHVYVNKALHKAVMHERSKAKRA